MFILCPTDLGPEERLGCSLHGWRDGDSCCVYSLSGESGLQRIGTLGEDAFPTGAVGQSWISLFERHRVQ